MHLRMTAIHRNARCGTVLGWLWHDVSAKSGCEIDENRFFAAGMNIAGRCIRDKDSCTECRPSHQNSTMPACEHSAHLSARQH